METIRAARREDIPGIARVHVDSWRTTYRGIVPDEVLERLSYERREQSWASRWDELSQKNQFLFVALDASEGIVGFAGGGPEREGDPIYVAELYAIYLLKEFQGRGLGRRLTQAFVEKLVEAGMSSMLIWALAENPACSFYQRLGGQLVKSKRIEIGGKQLDEVAFGWLDIHPLL